MREIHHYEVQVGREESVQVLLNHEAKIFLVDDRNWERLRSRQRFRYCGRSRPRSSVVLRPEYPGRWHLVIDDRTEQEEDGLSAQVTLI